MRTIRHVNDSKILYERFSAGNALCWVKLDRHKGLGTIEDLDNKCVAKDNTQRPLNRVVEDIAVD